MTGVNDGVYPNAICCDLSRFLSNFSVFSSSRLLLVVARLLCAIVVCHWRHSTVLRSAQTTFTVRCSIFALP